MIEFLLSIKDKISNRLGIPDQCQYFEYASEEDYQEMIDIRDQKIDIQRGTIDNLREDQAHLIEQIEISLSKESIHEASIDDLKESLKSMTESCKSYELIQEYDESTIIFYEGELKRLRKKVKNLGRKIVSLRKLNEK